MVVADVAGRQVQVGRAGHPHLYQEVHREVALETAGHQLLLQVLGHGKVRGVGTGADQDG